MTDIYGVCVLGAPQALPEQLAQRVMEALPERIRCGWGADVLPQGYNEVRGGCGWMLDERADDWILECHQTAYRVRSQFSATPLMGEGRGVGALADNEMRHPHRGLAHLSPEKGTTPRYGTVERKGRWGGRTSRDGRRPG